MKFSASLKLFEPETDEVSVNGATFKKSEVLMFKDAAIARVETNKNGDDISDENINELVATLPLKPISIEHESGTMAGIFTDAKRVGDAAVTSGLVYTKHTPLDTLEELVEGKQSLSIEAGAEKATCSKCGLVFATSDEYCTHLKAKKIFNAKRGFQGMYATGGGIVKRPAGSGTGIAANSIQFIASQMEEECEDPEEEKTETPEEGKKENDAKGKHYSAEQRKEMADKGEAKADGSFPIADAEDLVNAIHDWGRAGATSSDKAHIVKRAKALGLESKLPEDWVKSNEELDALKAQIQEKVDELTRIQSENETLKARNAELEQAAAQAKVQARREALIQAGVFTPEEWDTQNEVVAGMSDAQVQLLVEKASKPQKKFSLAGAISGGLQPQMPEKPSEKKIVFR